jgi:hypothetical protein
MKLYTDERVAVLRCGIIRTRRTYRYGSLATGFYSSAMSKDKQPIFRVIFLNQGQVFELYARNIFQSDLWGFLEIEELLFGERSQVLVDPAEEKLKTQFEGVARSFIPLQSIVRIDEVERIGQARISEAKGGGNVMSFPMPPTT